MTKNNSANRTLDLFTTDALQATPPPPTARPLPEKYAVPVFRLRLVRERDHLTEQVTTPQDAARIACEMLEDYDREVFLVLALSVSNRIIAANLCHVGTVDASIACGREVFKFALLCNARSIIVAHNHPSGNLEPSSADVQVSQQLRDGGEAIGVRLLGLVRKRSTEKAPDAGELDDGQER